MDVKSIILGFLMHGSMTGYELKKFFTLSFSFFSGLSYGSIYPALKGMEKEGLISMQIEAHADRFQNLCYQFGRRFFNDLTRNISQVVKDLGGDDVKPLKAIRRSSHGKAA